MALMVCCPSRGFPYIAHEPRYPSDRDHTAEVANFVVANLGDDDQPSLKELSVDHIDRFGEPSYGSGNVWIAHARAKSTWTFDPLDLWVLQGNTWKVKSYSDPQLRHLSPIYSRSYTWGTCPCTFKQDVRESGTVYASTARPYSPSMKHSYFDGEQFVSVGGYTNAFGYQQCWYYRRPVKPTVSGVCYSQSKNFEKDWTLERAISVMESMVGSGSTRRPEESSQNSDWLRISYMPTGHEIAKMPTLENTTAYSQWRYTCEFGTTGDGRSNAAFGNAYLDAVENLPALYTNNIANLVQLVEAAKAIIQIFLGELPTVAIADNIGDLSKEAWLAYRYQYSTTVSDIRELAGYLDRISSVTCDRVKTHGSFYDELDGSLYRCTMSVDAGHVIPPDIREALKSPYWVKTLGLAMTPENIWDMIPFSFMVDWFLHVGDALSRLTLRERSFDLIVEDVWYAYSRSWVDRNHVDQSVYYRFKGAGYTGLPIIITDKTSSGKTWSKRVGDTIAIFG